MRMLVRTERLLPVLFVSVVLGEPSPAWPLYPSGVAPFDLPGFYSNESVHHWPAGRVLFNVTNVTLTPYLVDASHPLYTGASVIVAPGGAYKWLTYDAEGTDIVAWLNAIGVSAFLLTYRVPFRPWLEPDADPSCCRVGDASCCITAPNYTDPRSARAPLIDAQRALSVVRCRGAGSRTRDLLLGPTPTRLTRCPGPTPRRSSRELSLGLNASAVGFIGFSAGGHLGAQLGTTGRARRVYPRIDAADDAPWRPPDWLMLVYPAYLVPNGNDVPPSGRTVTLNVTAAHPPTLLVQSEDGGFSYGAPPPRQQTCHRAPRPRDRPTHGGATLGRRLHLLLPRAPGGGRYRLRCARRPHARAPPVHGPHRGGQAWVRALPPAPGVVGCLCVARQCEKVHASVGRGSP